MSQILVTLGIILTPILMGRLVSRWRNPPNNKEQSQPPPGTLLASILNQPSAQPPPELMTSGLTPKLKFILACLIVHELVVAFEFLLNPPSNVFKDLRLPVTIPESQLRQKLLSVSDVAILPPHLEYLLNRLQSFDVRTFYIRFGHQAVVSCTHCRSLMDYLFFHISKINLDYVRVAGLITVMTIKGSGKRKWRRWGLAAVAGAWLYEVWTTMNSNIVIPRNGFDCEMLHDDIWLYRQIFFFVGPLVLHFLPYSFAPLSPFRHLLPATMTMERITRRLGVASVIQEGAQRDPTFRQRTADYWAQQGDESAWARQDPFVRVEAEKLGMGYYDGTGSPLDLDIGAEGQASTALRDEAKGIVASMLEVLSGVQSLMTAPSQSAPNGHSIVD